MSADDDRSMQGVVARRCASAILVLILSVALIAGGLFAYRT